MRRIYDEGSYPLQSETEAIIRTGIEIHKILKTGFLEIVYKDAFEYEYRNKEFSTKRKEYLIHYKDCVLPHKFYADFVVLKKSNSGIKRKKVVLQKKIMPQTLNYLKCSGCKIGLILNFGKLKLEIKG